MALNKGLNTKGYVSYKLEGFFNVRHYTSKDNLKLQYTRGKNAPNENEKEYVPSKNNYYIVKKKH